MSNGGRVMALAKTTPPRVTGLMARRRLFRRLDRGRKQPATWVWGPPGAGKTTLVATYLADRRLRTLWYQVDTGDADIATFFYYLRQLPRRRNALPLLTPEYRPGLAIFARRYFRELYGQFTRPFVLVLDNYQDSPADALLHDVVREAIEELPARGRIIIISRAEPPPALARLRVNQMFDTVGWADLRLTRPEATALARRLTRTSRPETAIRRLHELSDGWIAGLVLLLSQPDAQPGLLSSAGPPNPPRQDPRSQLLFDYFAGEIFRQTDARTRDVLLQTAFLPTVTAQMAVALTGLSDASRVVVEMHRQNYFTNRRPGTQAAYEYHPLFREFLLTEARRTLTADRLTAIRRTAAGLVEAAGQVEAAAALLREAGDWESLSGLICRHAFGLLAHGRGDTVAQWIGTVPELVVADSPWLLCWRGMCRVGQSHEECRRDCELALAAFRRQSDVDGMWLAWSTIAVSHLIGGWFVPLGTLIDRADELRRESPTPASPDIEARIVTTMLLAIAFSQPAHPDGPNWAARALALARGHPDLTVRVMAATGWFLYHWQRGEAYKASLVSEEVRAIALRRDIPSLIALHAAVPLLWHELLWALPSYHRTVVEVRAYASESGLRHVLTGVVAFWGSLAALSDGDLDTARSWIRDMAAETRDFGVTFTVGYHGAAALEALASGDVERAAVHEREMARLGYTSGMPNEEALAHVTAAYVCHARGAVEETRAHLERALEVAAAMESTYHAWSARLAEAYICFDQSLETEGLDALRTAMALGRAGGFVNSPVWRPSVMAVLCARALEAGIEVEYARELVSRRRLICNTPPATAERWPWAVKVFTLGKFAVLSDDRPLRFAGKVQRKPLALLKAIIVLGSPGVREERLMDILWPDAEGDAARRALTTAVFRLRRLLRHDAAVLRADGEISLNPAYCWVDLWAVERRLDQAEAPLVNGNEEHGRSRAASWIEHAVALYRGPLLGSADDAGWSGMRADMLRRRLLRQLSLLGRARQIAGEWQAAADLFETAVRVDPCAEEAYRDLMIAYKHLDRPDEVRSVYERCCENLGHRLGVSASAATEAVLRASLPPRESVTNR